MAGPPPVGRHVRIRGERWTVERTGNLGACTIVDVRGSDADNRHRRATFVLPFETCELVHHALRPKKVTRRGWRRLARQVLGRCTPSPLALRCAATARFEPLPFQLEPALACVRGDATRVLLADAVGLGKTIQAGLIVAEVLERRRDARALIVVPAGLREQWEGELRDRFALDASVMDASGLARLASSLPPELNPWTVPRVAITSIDFVKRGEVIRSLEPLVWDVVVLDEAHALCGSSDRAAAAGRLATRGRWVVLITATPHGGDDGAFGRLCAVGDIEGRFPLTVFRRSRAQLGLDAPRRTRWFRIRPSRHEALVHEHLVSYSRVVWRDAASPGARLAMLVLLKRGASSVAALGRSLQRRRAALLACHPEPEHQLTLPLDGEDEGADDILSTPGLADRAFELTLLNALLATTHSGHGSTKLDALKRLLRRTSEQVVVFTQYRDTLEELAAALAEVPHACLHGGLSTRDRRDAEAAFVNGSARVLLATDAASEGLNLHARCRLVVCFDPPWTAVRLEQRIGRVDRIGQRHRVHAWQLIVDGSYEEVVASRVRSQAALAHAALDEVRPEDELSTAALVVGANPGAPTVCTLAQPAPASPESLTAMEEAARIQTSRALLRHTTTLLPDVPFASVWRRPPRHVVVAFKAVFANATSDHAWETIVGVVTDVSRAPDRGPEWWLDEPGVRDYVSAMMSQHEEGLSTLVRHPAAQEVHRAQAIERQLIGSRARLAAALIQPELFSGRAERAMAPQLAMLDESLRRVERIVADAKTRERLALESVTPIFALGLQ